MRPPAIFLLIALALALLPGCRRKTADAGEMAYVAAPQVNLRDRIAPLYNKVGLVKNGDRVRVLERQRRFVRVRSDDGAEGWIEQRYLVGQEVYDQLEELSKEVSKAPAQARAITHASLNLHVSPGRDTEHLYQLKEGERVEMVRRAVVEKPASMMRAPQKKEADDSDEPPSRPQEDWWLVRDARGHAGWALARLLDIDVPLEIAQYAEGQRIVSAFVLNEVQDGERRVPQYLTLVTENKDGLPYDYTQARIFTWNVKRHRYETAYRERKLDGVFPVTVGTQDFGKEGVLPVFTLRVKDDAGTIAEKKYRLIGPIVRRVLSPEEEQKLATQRAGKAPSRRRR